MAECRGSRAGHTGDGVGHQGDEQGEGQAKEAELGSSQGQAEGAEQDLDQWAGQGHRLGEEYTGRSALHFIELLLV